MPIREALFTTERLAMRNLVATDASDIQRLAGEREIADTTLSIPHPYTDGTAEKFIVDQEKRRDRGELFAVAITYLSNGEFAGITGLKIRSADAAAELGYWIGLPYWGRGLATEATAALVAYGFQQLRLNNIHAQVFTRNAASRRVLKKIGMKPEGLRPQQVMKWGVPEDIEEFGLLKSDFDFHADTTI